MPFAGLIAVFVAIADLIPLVGATLGAVVAATAWFIHSVPAGITVIVFFVVYQQLKNHLLQPMIFSRTVKLHPLAVFVAIDPWQRMLAVAAPGNTVGWAAATSTPPTRTARGALRFASQAGRCPGGR
ncbi:MAG TPA: AI-2E family transporter [Actinophytocola sp.]|nr:AI-2E family transporter [Actinophytocola sp.]